MFLSSTCQQIFLLLAVLQCGAATLSPPTPGKSTGNLLSRKRRYVAFPDGSSVSAAICLTIGVIGNPHESYLSWAENWGVAYNLPNYTWAKQSAHGFKDALKDDNNKAMIQRRSRRDLYEKIELIIENMGFNGHACIARALCESAKYLRHLRKRRGNMIEEIVKTIFSFPSEHVHSHEPAAIHQYDRIYRRAPREVHDCGAEYAECHFSLLELALGKYSVEPTKHGPRLLMPLKSNAFM